MGAKKSSFLAGTNDFRFLVTAGKTALRILKTEHVLQKHCDGRGNEGFYTCSGCPVACSPAEWQDMKQEICGLCCSGGIGM